MLVRIFDNPILRAVSRASMGQPLIVGDHNSDRIPMQTESNKGIDDREPFCILEPGPHAASDKT